MNRSFASIFAVSALACAAATAGPINPAPGPVTATQKTLFEIEPRTPLSLTNTPGDANSTFRITAPGSYYLTGSMTVPSNTNAIEVAASNVTIDLNGFSIVGAGGAVSNRGIRNDGVVTNIRVVGAGGSIRDLAGDAINLDTTGSDASISGLDIRNCRIGIQVGDRAMIRDVRVVANTNDGFIVGQHSILTGCVAKDNALSSAGAVGVGFTTGAFSSLRDCTADNNLNDGFLLRNSTTLQNCRAVGNDGNGGGFAVVSGQGANLIFVNCIAEDNTNGAGFNGAGYCLVRNCISRGNNVAGYLFGLALNMSSSVAQGNTGIGIFADSAILTDNSVLGNSQGGITLANRSVVVRNTISNHLAVGVRGIRLTGADSRVEDNVITLNTLGLESVVGKNLVVRNVFEGNTVALTTQPTDIVGAPVANSAGLAGGSAFVNFIP